MQLGLSDDEALVLFEWISGEGQSDRLPIKHPADRLAIWALEAMLEKTLVAPLRPDYGELLEKARERLIEKRGMAE